MRIICFRPDPPRRLKDSGIERGALEQGRMEEILRENENKYRFLVENLNEGIWMVDVWGTTVFANQKMAEILGYSVTDMIGMSAFAFVTEEDIDTMQQYLQRRKRGIRETFELELFHKSGARIHTLVAATPITDATGTFQGSLAGVLDISSQKDMEAQLRENEEKYRSIVESSAEAILIHRDGIIAYINAAGAKLLGASDPGEVIGRAIIDIIHPKARDQVKNLVTRHLREEETPLIEIPIIRLDGTTATVEGRGTRAHFAGGSAVQVVMRDITHRKRREG